MKMIVVKKKNQQLSFMRDDKNPASIPPSGAPSWYLTREALEKYNHSTENISTYDYDMDDMNHDINQPQVNAQVQVPACELALVKTDNRKVQIAAEYLKNAALDWYIADTANIAQCRRIFSPFKKLLRKVSNTNNQVPTVLQVHKYLYGLNPQYTPMVFTNNSQDLNAIIKRAKVVETVFNYVFTNPVSLEVSLSVNPNPPIITNSIVTDSHKDTDVNALIQQLQQMTFNYANLTTALLAQNHIPRGQRPFNNNNITTTTNNITRNSNS
ncbi:hypothetical protein C1645_841351 [Glomus cerebriforme]|uniref:Uncharacterized protein n=1 Tax=Glomus cerebriforme TaxID=658196 RepID=A0A397S0V1_9GLOM|nr:hypothetical protein C1645_841351 [Glomus cerebriforme]